MTDQPMPPFPRQCGHFMWEKRAKMVENAVSVEMLSNLIGTSKSTFYRKLTNKGEDFTVGEANAIARALALSAEEFTAIFFA